MHKWTFILLAILSFCATAFMYVAGTGYDTYMLSESTINGVITGGFAAAGYNAGLAHGDGVDKKLVITEIIAVVVGTGLATLLLAFAK